MPEDILDQVVSGFDGLEGGGRLLGRDAIDGDEDCRVNGDSVVE